MEHVLALVDPETDSPTPPPLANQRHAPDLVASLLYRSIADSAVHEALAIVLDTGLYRRDVTQYQLTGVARVQPGATTVLGDMFGTVSRFLGQARTALFHQRTSAAPSTQIALLRRRPSSSPATSAKRRRICSTSSAPRSPARWPSTPSSTPSTKTRCAR